MAANPENDENELLQIDKEGRHLEQVEGQQVASSKGAKPKQPTRAEGQKKGAKEVRPSVRRNRDYSAHLTWTYELNKDLHECFLEADKSVYGYSGRMKKLWDNIHPEYAHLTAKHLTTQINRIQKKGLIFNAEDNETPAPAGINRSNIQPEERVETPKTIGDGNSTSENIQTIASSDNRAILEESQDLTDMINNIKPQWTRNYEKYLNIEVQERKYLTKKDRKIEELELQAANRITEDKLTDEGDNINLWKLNVMQYTTAITLLERHGKLREKNFIRSERKAPGWILNLENQINAVRRNLSHVTLILSVEANNLTWKQLMIKKKLKKIYGSTKNSRLIEAHANLKHELRIRSKKLRNKRIVKERQRINTLFNTNTKAVFREFRKDKKIDVTEPPPKEDVKKLWSDIWAKEGRFNSEAKWLQELREGYCQNARANIQSIKFEHFNKVTGNLKDGNSPGRDLIVGYWIKRISSLRQATFNLYQNINTNNTSIPKWLIKTRTTLLAKNDQTHNPKNFRPIACENLMMKVYTGCIAALLEEHCVENEVIYPEQAGAKKGMWGCTDQLLINKVVLDEIRKYRRNLCTIWLDYKKVYDSVPF